ncbi:MAG: kynureninase [Phycisphaeraceae bacterium]|nr:kynureninase [Phycisphaeraceae bacterium]
MPDALRTDEAFALDLDASDPLRAFRGEFHLPLAGDLRRTAATAHSASPLAIADDEPAIYLTGNSLGLQPRSTREALMQELDDWARLGVEGHFHAQHPWYPAHEELRGPISRLIGAKEAEVVAMNSLTVNLHLLMVSFYRPRADRYRILMEDSAFPSDSYAIRSQADFHARASNGAFNQRDAVVRLVARDERTGVFATDEILGAIDRHADSAAMLLMGGVNYRTGQVFDMARITEHARSRGIIVGWDLAHAAGNIPLALHEWGVDFAAWCSYKYLNSGPGSVAGAFVHERHLGNTALPRFAGWWGNDPSTRFVMGPDFVPVARADAWSTSNPPILSLAAVRASLALFDRATIAALRDKSVRLTGYLEQLLVSGWPRSAERGEPAPLEVLTPSDPKARGCQLSIRVPGRGREMLSKLLSMGVVCDFREPDVVRAAPVPLYNSYHDAWRFAAILRDLAASARD